MLNWFSGLATGMGIVYVWFMSTHNCYSTLMGAGMICSTHPFSFDWLTKGWN